MSVQKVRSILLRIIGYIVPLVQQIPPLGIYTGLMTLPVLSNIVLLPTWCVIKTKFRFILSQSCPDYNIQGLKNQIWPPFQQEWALLGIGVCIVGLLLAIYSIIYLGLQKKKGLVSTGPYRYIRHPQYTGFLILTIGLSGYSYWILTNTFGMGWRLASLSAKQTVIVIWYMQLGAYILLALIEESYTSKEFGDEFSKYKNNSSFFVPFGNVAKRYDILLSFFVLSIILFGVLYPSIFPSSSPFLN